MMPLLDTLAELRPDAFFVQIGSHDGQQQDPLRDLVLRGGWSGIMVEPVPYVFERLRRNYGHLPGLALENVAVGSEDGEVPFYHLADTEGAGREGLPIWFDALGSLRKEVVLAHERFIPDIERRLVETRVPCVTFDSLCRRHAVDEIDLLHTDTEGYDYEILRTVDFDRYRPKLIIYESVHQDAAEKAACEDHLRSAGYDTTRYGLDTWAINPEALSRREYSVLLPVWRWILDAESRRGPLAMTRAMRAAARRIRPRSPAMLEELTPLFALTEHQRRYFANGYDDRVPLPRDAQEYLVSDNPRLLELRAQYEALDVAAVDHHWWSQERVDDQVQLQYFRGDNLYQWHYPEHPRAMALTLFVYMRYLETRGARPLLDRCSEDGLFGCWTTEVAGYGKVSRDLLDSVSEILFLERQLGLLGRKQARILDIGAGYGRLGYRIATVHESLSDYCCVDAVPQSTFLSEYYLGFREVSPPCRVVPLDRVERDLHPGAFDLAVNVHSFSECTLAAIDWWAQQLARLEVPHLFVVPNEAEGLISREPNGGWHDALPTLAAAGYEPVFHEPVIADPAVRELVRIYDNFYLFARNDGASKQA